MGKICDSFSSVTPNRPAVESIGLLLLYGNFEPLENKDRRVFFSIKIVRFFVLFCFFILAALDLGCSMQNLQLQHENYQMWHVGSSFLTRDRTHVLCFGTVWSFSRWTTREVPAVAASAAAAAAKSLQSCPTLCNPIGGSPPGSPVPGILQARTLEWVAISFSNA